MTKPLTIKELRRILKDHLNEWGANPKTPLNMEVNGERYPLDAVMFQYPQYGPAVITFVTDQPGTDDCSICQRNGTMGHPHGGE